jgi:hypothetical protein
LKKRAKARPTKAMTDGSLKFYTWGYISLYAKFKVIPAYRYEKICD